MKGSTVHQGEYCAFLLCRDDCLPISFPIFCRDQQIHKTGLGSSAALVTSLVAAVLSHHGIVQIQNDTVTNRHDHSREFVHRIAQFSHCLSQGKIGSGFDVSSACFGSQKYTRFNPRILDSVLEKSLQEPRKCRETLLEELIDTLELASLHDGSFDKTHTRWDHVHQGFNLPPHFHLFVGDVDQGSNTPTLVSQVLRWRKEKSESANNLWNRIYSLNREIEAQFERLTQLSQDYRDQYCTTLSLLCNQHASDWGTVVTKTPLGEGAQLIVECMIELRTLFYEVRRGMKEMGEQAGVHIEPSEQTSLIDITMDVEGCLLGGVPGAGGYDAIFCILFSGDEEQIRAVRARVQDEWIQFKEARVTPLLLSESRDQGLLIHKEV